MPDPSHVLQAQEVEISEDLSYEERPVAIVDTQVRQLRSKVIPMEECTWESEQEMQRLYPYLF